MKMKKISKKNEPARENILKCVEEYKSRINKDYACRKIAKTMGPTHVKEITVNNLIKKELHYFDLLEEEIKYEWDDYEFSKYKSGFADTVSHETKMKNVAFFIKYSCCSLFEHFE